MKKSLLFKILIIGLSPIMVNSVTSVAMNNAVISTENSDLFKTKFSNYIYSAKQLSQKKMTQEEGTKLANEAFSLIEDLKNRYITEKLQVKDVKLKYLDGREFPELSEHQNNSASDKKIVQFAIASHALFKILIQSAASKDFISKIIEKSPLEIVSVIKELSVFMQFISANPNNFGHGVFSEKQGDNLVVFATNDAILRIMKGLIYKNLLQKNKIYKMSRIGTKIVENISNNFNEELINDIIASLKRSTADDTRISIDVPEAMLDLSMPNANEFQMISKNYIDEINLSKRAQDISDKQIHMNKAMEFAKVLLGIIPGVKLNVTTKTFEFCTILEQKRMELKSASESDDQNISLKAKRDIANYTYSENFLKCTAILLDAMYRDSQILPLIIEKMAEFVPNIGQEITMFLRALELIVSQDADTEKIISKLREFAKSSEDGNYLLSPLLSVAMENVSTLDYKNILISTDFSNNETCKYLKIK